MMLGTPQSIYKELGREEGDAYWGLSTQEMCHYQVKQRTNEEVLENR